MCSKILLFSRDPGGANTIFPLIDPLKESGFLISLYGKDFALNRYKQFGFEGKNIMDEISFITVESLISFLKANSPDFIITGTSENDFTEKYMWKAAEQLHIPCFAILDYWVNYSIRFSAYNCLDIKNYDSNNASFPYLPTKILVMDEYAKKKMIDTGIDKNKIIISGQSYFDLLLNIKNKITLDEMKECRKFFKCDKNDFLIIFASEPITEYYNETDDSDHYWGYSERTIFRKLCEAILIVLKNIGVKIKIVLRPHPKEDHDNFFDLKNEFNQKGLDIVIDRSYNPFVEMKAADLVIGMSSMFLTESAILGTRIMSVQIGLTRENPFILDHRGIVKSILTFGELIDQLYKIIVEEKINQQQFNIEFGAIKKILNYVKGYLNQNKF